MDGGRAKLNSALKLLFESEISDRLTAFLRHRGERARIVAPRWVRSHVLSDIPPNFKSRATWVEEPFESGYDGRSPCNFIVLAEDATQERAIMKSVALLPGCKAYGFFRHVVPALICHADGLAQPSSTASLKRYAILCVPRSGSRYLAATLTKAGVGAPLEHLRTPLATIATTGKLGFASSLKAMERYGHANGIFGTKLVSTFLLEASSCKISMVERNVEWLAKRGYCFVHLDRPLIESVVSSYVAVHLKKWHYFAPLDDMDHQKLESAPFLENQIWGEYLRFKSDKAIMNRLVRRHGIQTFHYQDVCDRAERIVGWICDQLSVDVAKLESAASIQIPVATRSQSSIYDEFTGRLRELLRSRRSELDSEIVKTIGQRTGLKRNPAQTLLEEYEESAAALQPAL